MRSGRKKERIGIYKNETGTTPGGGMSEPQEVLYWETWAEVTPLKAKRTLEAYQIELKGGYEIKLRYRSDKVITNDMTVKYKGKSLVIHSIINNNEADREIILIGMRND